MYFPNWKISPWVSYKPAASDYFLISPLQLLIGSQSSSHLAQWLQPIIQNFSTSSHFISLYDITLMHRGRSASTCKDLWGIINVQAVTLSKTLDSDFYFSALITFFHIILDFSIMQIHCISNSENPLMTKTTFPHFTSFVVTESATCPPHLLSPWTSFSPDLHTFLISLTSRPRRTQHHPFQLCCKVPPYLTLIIPNLKQLTPSSFFITVFQMLTTTRGSYKLWQM